MQRREFLARSLWAAAGTVPAFSRTGLGALRGPGRRPNIILILADDLGYGHIEPYGQRKIKTPSLARMANEGLSFSDFYTAAPICAPARCALMTGLHTGHTRIRGNETSDGQVVFLQRDDLTLAEVLKTAGYRTGLIGKWGLGLSGTEGAPWKKGFDYFYGFLGQGQAHSYYPEFVYENDTKIDLPGNSGNQGSIYIQDEFMKKSLEFVKDNIDRPFFLYLPFTLPHDNLIFPPGTSPSDFDFDETPWWGPGRADQEHPRAALAAMITRLDRDVGRILDRLRDLGIADQTLVLFTSDNGPSKTPDDIAFFHATGPFRGGKAELYEGGIRMPLIAWWPGRVPAGEWTGLVAAFYDLFPTFCELAGKAPPEGLDGLSLVPTLVGRTDDQAAHDYLYWEFPAAETASAVRMGRYKAIRPAPNVSLELYDLVTDPGESQDISSSHQTEVDRAEAIMAAASVPSPYWPVQERTLRTWFEQHIEWPLKSEVVRIMYWLKVRSGLLS